MAEDIYQLDQLDIDYMAEDIYQLDQLDVNYTAELHIPAGLARCKLASLVYR